MWEALEKVRTGNCSRNVVPTPLPRQYSDTSREGTNEALWCDEEPRPSILTTEGEVQCVGGGGIWRSVQDPRSGKMPSQSLSGSEQILVGGGEHLYQGHGEFHGTRQLAQEHNKHLLITRVLF